MTEQQKPPVIEVVAGSPTPEEIAAIVTVVSALAAAPAEEKAVDQPRVGGWRSYYRALRRPFVHGPGAWRTIPGF
ncbi:acyl-CoA carboxylase subunit epsilon [Granulicoccus phenolivorans]|uniref:acyl-CoA carboxylase subunit epsilon n=1 Tax=Granulicoccus phenolivorans TaxID=266854 RepID=UPI0004039EA8|nr:acyl-CoA carboxylase subunit epsilon [Granulicoccus phenolivorans]